MLLNKKGIGWDTISKWVFALIVIAILWILFINLGDFLYGTGNQAACKNWVYRNSIGYVKEFAGNLENSPCVTTEETIKDLDRNKIHEQLAQNMYTCWDQYGQGEKNFYSDIGWIDKELYCRICSEIKIDENVKREIKEIDVDSFEIYLNSHNPPNHKETYADFFTRSENSKIDFGSGKISLNGNLYTMFTAYRGGDYSAKGFVSKLVLTPIAVIAGGSQVPGAGKITRGVGGLVSKAGSSASKTGWGIVIVYVSTVSASFFTDQGVLYPTLMVVSSDSTQITECDAGVYYNPEKKPFDFVKK